MISDDQVDVWLKLILNSIDNLTIVSFELHIYDLAPRNLQQV